MESNRYRWLPKVQMVTNVTNGEYLAIWKQIAIHSLKATLEPLANKSTVGNDFQSNRLQVKSAPVKSALVK
jgi:hypothetical protein